MTVDYGAGAHHASPTPSAPAPNAKAAALRGLLLPGLATVIALGILLSLGFWQLHRLDWKNALEARITQRLKAPPVSLSTALKIYQRSPEEAEYSRVKLSGRFLNDRETHLYALQGKGAGWHIITPLALTDGRYVFVNRGFVPEKFKSAKARAGGQIAGQADVVGLLRGPGSHHGMFRPDNNPKQNRWFSLDLPLMTKTYLAGESSKALPFIVEEEARKSEPGWPAGGATRINFRNRHLEYALTWFGLAASLLGVFGFFAYFRLNSAR